MLPPAILHHFCPLAFKNFRQSFPTPTVAVSVLVSTYNRCGAHLRRAKGHAADPQRRPVLRDGARCWQGLCCGLWGTLYVFICGGGGGGGLGCGVQSTFVCLCVCERVSGRGVFSVRVCQCRLPLCALDRTITATHQTPVSLSMDGPPPDPRAGPRQPRRIRPTQLHHPGVVLYRCYVVIWA